MSSYTGRVLDRINDFDSHKVFFTNDFLDITSYETARKTLSRMANERKTKRVVDDFYYNPRYSELIREYETVPVHELTLTIAKKYNWNIAPYSSTALDSLGLSAQVPTHYEYISSGRYKKYKIGDTILEFRKVNPGGITNMSLKTTTVIQTIRSLSKENITNEVIQKMREDLSKKERKDLMSESRSVLSWIREVVREISEGRNE